MNVYCYKVDQVKPVVIKRVRMFSAIETVNTFGQAIIDAGLESKYPDAAVCEDKLLTVSAVCDDGSMYTSYDVCNVECD